MGSISVIGLGAMGSAIASALVKSGQEVTVWNRTAAKAEALAQEGAKAASSPAEAIAASEVTLMCLLGYDLCQELISSPEAKAALQGKTLLQVSTGAPAEARALEEFAHQAGAAYLDGCIMDYPRAIGEEETYVLLSGAQEAYDTCHSYLKCLAGDLQYIGEKVGAAAALDLSLLIYDLCGLLGVLHAGLICEAEGVDVTRFASFIGDVETEEAKYRAKVIQDKAFDEPDASIEVYDTILDRILGQAEVAGINKEIPAFTSSLFKRAMAQGMAGKEPAAIIKLLAKN